MPSCLYAITGRREVIMFESAAWTILPAAVAVTLIWRILGVIVSDRISIGSDLFLWVHCVAYAILAALFSRMLVFPAGAMSESESWMRFSAVGLSLMIFFVFKRNLLAGIVVGVGLFACLQYLFATG